MIHSLSLLACLMLQAPNADLDAEQMMKVLEGLHSEIRDFELVCEGETTWADRELREKSDDPGRYERIFQGSYAYRAADGAGYLDLYQKSLGPTGATFLHGTYANLKGNLTEGVRSSDQRNDFPGLAAEKTGGPGALTIYGSPERFIYLYHWRRQNYGVANKSYKIEGWEEIDGNVALRVWVDEFPKRKLPEQKWSRFWIDMKRGGHVVKHEFHGGSHLRYRTYNVVLASIKSPDGSARWFPVHGERDTFLYGTEYRATPVFHESYNVVRGSLVFNRGLTDERFSLDWKGHKAESPALQKAHQDFKSTPLKAVPHARTDPAGVEEDLKKRLAEADSQARQLDASPSRGWWNSTTLMQGGLTALGAGILTVVFFLRRRLS